MDRRNFVKTGSAAVLMSATVAGCMGDGDGDNGETNGNGGDTASFGGWMENAKNFDGSVTDETGADSVTVTVGAGDAGLAFGPAAVKVSPGTEIVWEWTGKGGGHNVVAKEGADFTLMEASLSNLVSEEGHTFSHTFDAPGTYKYRCMPHQGSGMVGVVVVE